MDSGDEGASFGELHVSLGDGGFKVAGFEGLRV